MAQNYEHNNYEYILFDLGHVLVELRGMPDLREFYPGLSDREIHRKWLSSEALRNFETGRIDSAAFSRDAPSQLDLDFSPAEFLELYEGWLIGEYAESETLIGTLKETHRVGCLSNTSELHINKLRSIGKLLEAFNDRFLSYEIGYMKPGHEIYQIALEEMDLQPEKVLFLDDSIDNVETAQSLGIDAVQVFGIAEVKQCLEERLLDQPPQNSLK